MCLCMCVKVSMEIKLEVEGLCEGECGVGGSRSLLIKSQGVHVLTVYNVLHVYGNSFSCTCRRLQMSDEVSL